MAMGKLQCADPLAPDLLNINSLLKRAGFSQNGRNSIIHLSGDEINALCEIVQEDESLWHPYLNEIQTLLNKMNQVRKNESYFEHQPFMGRPYITKQLANTVSKLTHLRCMVANGIDTMQVSKLRSIFMDHEEQLTQESLGEPISILSAIWLLERYRDELIMPPRLKSRQNFDEFDQDMIITGDFSWMDDDGESVMEDIRDMPQFTLYDAMPDFSAVADWFITMKPVLDSNQLKRGWAYLEKSSEEWHKEGHYYYSEDNIAEYPSWNCTVAERQEEWLAFFPSDNPYAVIPLTTPQHLLDESRTMHHCVVNYLDSCISGDTRIFSIRSKKNNHQMATAELTIQSGKWALVQLKGKHNMELMYRLSDSENPFAISLSSLVKWYNENSF